MDYRLCGLHSLKNCACGFPLLFKQGGLGNSILAKRKLDSSGDNSTGSPPKEKKKKKRPTKLVYPLGAPPAKPPDSRRLIHVGQIGTDLYMDNGFEKYRLKQDPGGAYLEKITSHKDPAKKESATFKQMLPLKRKNKKTNPHPIYPAVKGLIESSSKGDEVFAYLDALDPETEHGRANKEWQDEKIRDDAKKLKKDNRGTGSDEGMQTSGFSLALLRDSGFSLEPDIRKVDKGKHGQTVTRLDFHEHNRTGTRFIPLIGGPDYNHPGTATKTSRGQDHLSRGNSTLDHERMKAILEHHGPATEFGASAIAQVQQMKPPRDVIKSTNVSGYDPRGRDFTTDEDARQDLAFGSGWNRELLKRTARMIPEEFPGSSPLRVEDLSSDDENYDIPETMVLGNLLDPSNLSKNLIGLSNPRERPTDWLYKKKKSQK